MSVYTDSNVVTHDLPNDPGTVAPEAPLSLWADAWRRIRGSRSALLCVAVVAAYVLVGFLSFLPIFDQKINEQISPDKSYAAPALFRVWTDGRTTHKALSPARWFGLDFQGRSVFWEVLYGTRVALLITVAAGAIMLIIGTVLGVLAGFYGGWIDALITWLFSTVSSIPWLLLVISLAYVLQGSGSPGFARHHPHIYRMFGGTTTVILALGLTDWVTLCRLMRGEVIKLRDLDYVAAARALGLGDMRVLFRHVLPNTLHIIIITFSIAAVTYVQVEVVLAFLGIGVSDKPSWGRMIDDAKLALLRGVWWEVTAATIAIFVLCLALNVLGDALRDALDPRLRGAD